ncbi:MAG: ATP-binding protein [Ginsengibacter sp.]
MKPKIKSITKSDRKLHASKADKKLVKRITTSKNWNDLPLGETTRQKLNDISTWIGNANSGDTNAETNKDIKNSYKILFSGSRRTGKKLAAKLLGKHYSLDVYRINLSKLVSKYIGETEKNLNSLFDAAEASHAILFFDEADALFGKRTNVSDAHDRYKAPVISGLMQRLEEYPGLVIFSSKKYNVANNVFTQPLNAVINFEKAS